MISQVVRETGRSRKVNDVHSGLNATRVREIQQPQSHEALTAVIRQACRRGMPVSIAGRRNAMGGQQFLTDGLLLDTRRMNRVLRFDRRRGLVDVQAGITWPELIESLAKLQPGEQRPWSIVQKQTGADRLSLGGALASNVHGRGLTLAPFIGDVESFLLVDARGRTRLCSRNHEPELFRLAIGGYGLFGAVSSIRLRLARRRRVRRIVELTTIDRFVPGVEQRIAEGCRYGDFQFSVDPESDDFLNRGIFSCYQDVPDQGQDGPPRILSQDGWKQLLLLAHTDKRRAFEVYTKHYLATDGQLYWSDTHQLSNYVDDYHQWLDPQLGLRCRGSEIISEIFVPRSQLPAFLQRVRADFRRHGTNLIYGTVRLIERDNESFLAWAREPWACVIFNLCTLHDRQGVADSAAAFRRLIDRAIEFGGSYYLTYHRFAGKAQLQACYPQFGEFLQRKREYDPEERFQSDWYRHHRDMFG